MIRRLLCLAAVLAAGPAAGHAQTPLSLPDAVARAREHNLDARAAALAEQEAAARMTAARAGYLPTVDLAESWQRGNQPVFVFSSLLAQRQFAAANFAIDALNHPDAVGNLRIGLTAEQALLAPATRAGVRSATLAREAAAASREAVRRDLAVAVTREYGAVLAADAAVAAAKNAVATATTDRELAGARRDAGAATDADVLQLDVYLARMREQHIRRAADVVLARARLNQTLGAPLDAEFVLEPLPLPDAASSSSPVDDAALASRPDLRLAGLRERQAEAAVAAARAAWLPTIHAQAVWEANGDAFASRASSWMVGAVARVNLFRGLGDRARLAEARVAQSARAVEREKAEVAARLEVRTAAAALDAARAANAVGRAAVDQAREGHRIIRDRYESGLADVAALLSAADAVQDAEARHAAARVEVTIAAAVLTHALGKE